MTSATNHATLSRTTSACSLPISLSPNPATVILPFSAIVVLLHPSICERTDDSEAHGGRPTSGPARRALHHFYRLDPCARTAAAAPCRQSDDGAVLRTRDFWIVESDGTYTWHTGTDTRASCRPASRTTSRRSPGSPGPSTAAPL